MRGDDLPADVGEPHPGLALAPDEVAATNLELEVDRCEVAPDRQDLEPAASDFARAVELNSALPEAFVGRGVVRFAAGDLEGAVSDLRRAILLGATDAEARRVRAAACLEQGSALADGGRYDDAAQLLLEALETGVTGALADRARHELLSVLRHRVLAPRGPR